MAKNGHALTTADLDAAADDAVTNHLAMHEQRLVAATAAALKAEIVSYLVHRVDLTERRVTLLEAELRLAPFARLKKLKRLEAYLQDQIAEIEAANGGSTN